MRATWTEFGAVRTLPRSPQRPILGGPMDEAPTPIRVTVNGEPHEIPPAMTVDDLLDRFGLDRRHTAVERNRALVPRAAFTTTVIEAEDVLEIVTLVGGG